MTSQASQPASGTLDEASLAALIEQHRRALWCIAVSVVRDRALADDVVQEAAMIALAKRHEFTPGSSFPAWAGQIVRYTALNEARKQARAPRQAAGDDRDLDAPSPAAHASASPGSRVAAHHHARHLEPRLAAALDTLEQTARECLILRTTTDMTYAAIAAALGIPEGTAMSHVHRARQTLRRVLAGSALDPSSSRGPASRGGLQGGRA
ncbi:MAG: sigma-70 family RNA polymerase sigma factor [Phycisphaerae bacterium]|nr:sigma-70 family RNA polymerase sigma factor [Phycisphaerae bacterium]